MIFYTSHICDFLGISEEQYYNDPGKYSQEFEKMDKQASEISEAYGIVSRGTSEKIVAKILFTCLRFDHRTMQQKFWRIIISLIQEYSKTEHDDRNEGSVKFCSDVVKMIDEGKITSYLPYI